MDFPTKFQEALDALPLLRDASGQPWWDAPSLPELSECPWVDPVEGALVVPGTGDVSLSLGAVCKLKPREELPNDALHTPASNAAGSMAWHDGFQPL
eukprot:2659438-Alexandrium_andersonii.AAC.1